jgi:peptidoglycan hydrolase-like protein with peptidoglycan-binding domain
VRASSLTCVAVAVAVAIAVSAAPAGARSLGANPQPSNPQQAGIQVALRAFGLYNGPIDGDVGPLTVAAIKAAQERRHLPVTGIATARTRAALGPLGVPLFGERVLAPRDFGLDVSVLQFVLLRDGIYKGALDGYLGKETQAAVRRYQRRVGLVPDGVVGPTTMAALVKRNAVPVRAKPAPPAPVQEPVQQPVYVVQSGDSLTAIASRFGVSLTTLAHANRFDPASPLLIGKRLTIPAPALEATPWGVRERLDAWSAKLGVSPHLVRALAWMESGYQPRVVSSAGARGVLQTLPETRQYVETVLAGHPIEHSLDGDIEVGVLYLRDLLAQFGGDTRLALAGWYQGADAVRKYGLYKVTKPFVEDVLALEARM